MVKVLLPATVILLLSLWLEGSHCQSRRIDPETQRNIDDYIEKEYLPASQISGIALAIVRDNGDLLYTTGYGLANKEKGIPNGNTTQCMVASVTKSFTSALAVKVLHEKFPHLGEAVLDTPIRILLPQINFTLIDRFRSEQATFRDLLAHRLCLFKDDLELLADPFDTTEEITYRQRYNPEVCGFRGEFQYNNQFYAVAGELIGLLAGRPYEDVMQDLLNDIGMLDTAFVQRTDDFDQMPWRSLPYYFMDNETYPMNPELMKRLKPLNAAGGLYVPPNDMVRYMRFHLNLGTIDGSEIVPKAAMEWLRKPSIVLPDQAFKNSDDNLISNDFAYGVGLIISSYDGWQRVQHSGGMPPHFSLMSLYPEKNLGIFTSTNMSPVMVAPEVLHSFIFETLQGTSNPMEKAMKVNDIIKNQENKKRKEAEMGFQMFVEKFRNTTTVNVNIVGKYGSGTAGDLEISERFNEETNQMAYYFEYGPWFRGWLEPAEEGVFKINYDTDIIHDDYALGFKDGRGYVGIENGTLTFFNKGDPQDTGTFQLGVSLDTLPAVPWSPDSCGPEVA